MYFQKYRYQSISSDDFVSTFKEKFPQTASTINFEQWLHGTGNCPYLAPVDQTLVDEANQLAQEWYLFLTSITKSSVSTSVEQARSKFFIQFNNWNPKQKLSFLSEFRAVLEGSASQDLNSIWTRTSAEVMEKTFELDSVRNSEIRYVWCRLGLKASYAGVLPNIKNFLETQGRMKFIRPLYQDLYGIYPGRDYATKLFNEQRNSYHNIASKMIARDLHVDK